MVHEVAWTDAALADLEVIGRYVSEHSPAAADKLRTDLIGSVKVLADFPTIGPVYEADPTGETREILCHRYRIFYTFVRSESRVEILAVRHGSRQAPE